MAGLSGAELSQVFIEGVTFMQIFIASGDETAIGYLSQSSLGPEEQTVISNAFTGSTAEEGIASLRAVGTRFYDELARVCEFTLQGSVKPGSAPSEPPQQG